MSEQTCVVANFVDQAVHRERFVAKANKFPWLATDVVLPVSPILLEDGNQILFASLVGQSNALRKVASKVGLTESIKAQEDLFVALPFLLEGQNHHKIQDFSKSAQPQGAAKLLETYNAAHRGHIVFALETARSGLATVVRTAVYRTQDKPRVDGVITGKTGRRRKTPQYKSV